MGSYERPLYGRVRLERVVLPLHVGEVAGVLGLGATGGDRRVPYGGRFPRVVLEWERGMPREEFLQRALTW